MEAGSKAIWNGKGKSPGGGEFVDNGSRMTKADGLDPVDPPLVRNSTSNGVHGSSPVVSTLIKQDTPHEHPPSSRQIQIENIWNMLRSVDWNDRDLVRSNPPVDINDLWWEVPPQIQ